MGGMKFRISCPEHSEFVQRKLFEVGCEWMSGENKKPLYAKHNKVFAEFLFVKNNKISFENFEAWFDSEVDHKDMTNHPDWQWLRPSETSDIKARVYRNQTAKNIGEKLTLEQKAEIYIAENQDIYKMFCRFAFEAISAGRETLSAGLITERIRWEAMLSGNDKFKVNNNYRAYMARKFMHDFKRHDGIFRTRVTKKEAERDLLGN